MSTNLIDRNRRVKCKKKLPRMRYVYAILFVVWAVGVPCVLLNVDSTEENIFGAVVVVLVSLLMAPFLYYVLFNNPVYFFTDKDVMKKELFGHEKVVLVYNDVDHYYLVHADYTNNGIGTPKKDIPFRIASEYWFMKGDEVVSTIGSDFQNIQEALKMIPSYFAGEIQLSREQSVKRDIRGVKTKEVFANYFISTICQLNGRKMTAQIPRIGKKTNI